MATRVEPAPPNAPHEERATAARRPRAASRDAAPPIDRTLLLLALLLAGCFLLAGGAAAPRQDAPPASDAPAVAGAPAGDNALDAGGDAPAAAMAAAEAPVGAGAGADADRGSAPAPDAAPLAEGPGGAVDAPSDALEGATNDAASAQLDSATAPKDSVAAPASSSVADEAGSTGPAAASGAANSTQGVNVPGSAADAAPAQDAAAGWAAASDGPSAAPEDPRTHVLSIERLRGLSYPGSDLVVVEELPAGANYSRAIVSYESEGNTIYGLFTVPSGETPATGWPVVIFNHGYIPPAQYRTTERYVAYQDAFARNGYITLKSDYRGHGSSEGEATGGRGTPDYTTDVMNAMASVARHPDADPNRIGMWGHSMGGSITLRSMVLTGQIKAGVIWAGVVASYPDMYRRLGQDPAQTSSWTSPSGRRSWRLDLVERFGTPEENPAAWDAVSPNAYLADISGPLQLHHGTADHSVPVEYSQVLQQQMEAAGRPSELFVYEGDDHNLSQNLSLALQRSVAFFDQHVKGTG